MNQRGKAAHPRPALAYDSAGFGRLEEPMHRDDEERALKLIKRARDGKGRRDVALVVRYAWTHSDLRLALEPEAASACEAKEET
jgi:hypothetical protein